MLNNLPVAYRHDQWVNDLLKVIRLADEKQRAEANDTAAQVLLDSMTWQLPAEEIEAGLKVSPSTPVEERRSALSAKWRSGSAKAGIELIRQLCETWDDVIAEVTYDGDSLMAVFFERKGGMPDNAAAMLAILRVTIPAHLLFTLNISAPPVSSGVYIANSAITDFRIGCQTLTPKRELSSRTSAGVMMDGVFRAECHIFSPRRKFSGRVFIGSAAVSCFSRINCHMRNPGRVVSGHSLIGATIGSAFSRASMKEA